jgi:putative tryptophan/tyrosine transport system substrate-binding protein
MRRREFITLLGGAAAWPLAARAQQPERVRRIGVLSIRAESDVDWRANIKMFQHRLQELGWTDGRNIQINYRGAAGNVERLNTLAKELADMAPDLLLAVRRQRSLDRLGGLNKGEFLAHRNVHRSEDETANPSIEGTS